LTSARRAVEGNPIPQWYGSCRLIGNHTTSRPNVYQFDVTATMRCIAFSTACDRKPRARTGCVFRGENWYELKIP
jgi:hypothetical protein